MTLRIREGGVRAAHTGAFWFLEEVSDARLRLARAAADTALALNPQLPEAHLADGFYWYWGWVGRRA